jgi:periplasmic divalent cation tolerance protein
MPPQTRALQRKRSWLPWNELTGVEGFANARPEESLTMSTKPAKQAALVLVTAPDLKTARKLARSALKARLIACANLVPGIESHYWWQNKIETGTEVLLLLKTTIPRLAALERLILAEHPYDTPEFIVLRVAGANSRYWRWWRENSTGFRD